MGQASTSTRPHTPVNRSALVDWLSRHSLLEGPAAAPSFVEGLGRWLGWKQAIALSAALQAPTTTPPRAAAVPAAALAALEREFARVQDKLVRMIEDDDARPGETHFAPFRRHCTAVQQAMEADLSALRATARSVLARQSSALSRLAALDAVMDEVVGPHEQSALAIMPSLLERHFSRAMQAPAADAGANANVAALKRFRQGLQQALRAELALRLQPTEGLLDALRAHLTTHP